MPESADPSPSDEQERAIEALGASAVRSAVIGFVHRNPACRMSDIISGLGLTASTAKLHVRHLLDAGVIVDDVQPGATTASLRGKRPRYSVDADALAKYYRLYGEHIGARSSGRKKI